MLPGERRVRLRAPVRIRCGLTFERPAEFFFAMGFSVPIRTTRGMALGIGAGALLGLLVFLGKPTEAPSELGPGEAVRIASDLSAAYLARAAREGDPRDLIRALDAAERAYELAPGRPEVLWNRAAALEGLVRRPAIEAWERVASLEKDSRWRDEGAARLARLRGPTRAERWRKAVARLEIALDRKDAKTARGLVAEHAAEVPDWIEERLLLDWLPALERGESARAERRLGRLAEVAGWLARQTGETELLVGIHSLAEGEYGEGAKWRALAVRGLRLWSEARLAFAAADYAAARLLFRQARRDLEVAGSPWAVGLRYWEARCANRLGAYAEGAAEARASLALPEVARSARWTGRLGWLLGAAQSSLGLDSEALATYRAARERSQTAGDLAGTASLETRLAAAEGAAGNELSAWRHRLRSLALYVGREDDPEYLVALAEAAYGAKELGAPRAALALQNEEVHLAREGGDALRYSLALRHQADLLGSLDPATRERSLAGARGEAERLAGAEARERTLRQIDFIEAGLVLRSEPRRALDLARRAAASFEVSAPTLLPSALLLGAQARRALGDPVGAAADLALAMERVEALRELRSAPSDRAALVAASSAIYDEAVVLALERGRAEEALDVAERARSRALLDWLGSPSAGGSGLSFLPVRPRPVSELVEHLPAGQAFVEYYVGGEQLSVFLVRREGVRHSAVPIGRPALRKRLAAVGRGRSPRQTEEELEGLYDLLIRPFDERLGPGEPLRIVADDALLSFGFAALRDRRTGRYLIEDRALAFSPSLNAAVRMAAPDPPSEGSYRSALVVADPEFAEELFPTLRRLPEAREEGRVIAGHWPSKVLSDRAATPRAVLFALPGRDLVHFGAHAQAFAEQPLRSRLILAPDPSGDDPGTLTAEALLRADLGAARLVVLAACDSAGRPSEEGAAGLAWPLLARGVPAVVAAVRPIDDRASARLLGDFYLALKAGLPVSEALRQAQRLRLAATRRLPAEALKWSVFQLIDAAEFRQP